MFRPGRGGAIMAWMHDSQANELLVRDLGRMPYEQALDLQRERLAERKAEVQDLCAVTGWQYGVHHTSESAQSALLWLYSAFERGTAR